VDIVLIRIHAAWGHVCVWKVRGNQNCTLLSRIQIKQKLIDHQVLVTLFEKGIDEETSCAVDILSVLCVCVLFEIPGHF
jgi:uncharacterized membrane-anchored protein